VLNRDIFPPAAALQGEQDAIQHPTVVNARATAFAFVLTRQERCKHRPLLVREYPMCFGLLFHISSLALEAGF
jgi:hypothetical protein